MGTHSTRYENIFEKNVWYVLGVYSIINHCYKMILAFQCNLYSINCMFRFFLLTAKIPDAMKLI